ncbi:MAG: hypothetical protein ACAI35_01675 [Candidatus Methylacidiphilales bacterium]
MLFSLLLPSTASTGDAATGMSLPVIDLYGESSHEWLKLGEAGAEPGFCTEIAVLPGAASAYGEN